MWAKLTSDVAKVALGMVVVGVVVLLQQFDVLDSDTAYIILAGVGSLTSVKAGHLVRKGKNTRGS